MPGLDAARRGQRGGRQAQRVGAGLGVAFVERLAGGFGLHGAAIELFLGLIGVGGLRRDGCVGLQGLERFLHRRRAAVGRLGRCGGGAEPGGERLGGGEIGACPLHRRESGLPLRRGIAGIGLGPRCLPRRLGQQAANGVERLDELGRGGARAQGRELGIGGLALAVVARHRRRDLLERIAALRRIEENLDALLHFHRVAAGEQIRLGQLRVERPAAIGDRGQRLDGGDVDLGDRQLRLVPGAPPGVALRAAQLIPAGAPEHDHLAPLVDCERGLEVGDDGTAVDELLVQELLELGIERLDAGEPALDHVDLGLEVGPERVVDSRQVRHRADEVLRRRLHLDVALLQLRFDGRRHRVVHALERGSLAAAIARLVE